MRKISVKRPRMFGHIHIEYNMKPRIRLRGFWTRWLEVQVMFVVIICLLDRPAPKRQEMFHAFDYFGVEHVREVILS